ncbi:5'/3'-nucleotidase SurE [Zavarzinella formosa]|uniref:5'/3'-nucleotidase SurE n=1 Tax=Zavarzinella formosa TaxID=360055 RepID=UPI0002EB8AA6|nr:5'/3'-nucleotidase SurE [Zavarzinella formosa]
MRILLTNDDGIYAPGLRALHKELKKLGDVVVCAPATEQSAAGHSVTLLSPLIVQEIFDENKAFFGWAIEGRPADCVKLALVELLPEPPDLIVSGLNAGSNAGINVVYSGTVAAAVEGAFFRCTAIALSQSYRKPAQIDFAAGAAIARQVVEEILAYKPQPGSLFNVNLPSADLGPPKGLKVLAQNVAPYQESFVRNVDPRGRTYYWLGADYGCAEPHPDTDESALQQGYVTLTPLYFDLTNHRLMDEMKTREWNLGSPRKPD